MKTYQAPECTEIRLKHEKILLSSIEPKEEPSPGSYETPQDKSQELLDDIGTNLFG